MMLVWRNDKAAVEPLEKLAREAEGRSPGCSALATLDGLNALTPASLRAHWPTNIPASSPMRSACAKAVSRPTRTSARPLVKLWRQPAGAVAAGCAAGRLGRSASRRRDRRSLAGSRRQLVHRAAALSSLTPKNFSAVCRLGPRATAIHPPPAAFVEGLLTSPSRGRTPPRSASCSRPRPRRRATFHGRPTRLLASLLDALGGRRSRSATWRTGRARTEGGRWRSSTPAFVQARQKAADAKTPPAERLAADPHPGPRPGDPAGDRASWPSCSARSRRVRCRPPPSPPWPARPRRTFRQRCSGGGRATARRSERPWCSTLLAARSVGPPSSTALEKKDMLAGRDGRRRPAATAHPQDRGRPRPGRHSFWPAASTRTGPR